MELEKAKTEVALKAAAQALELEKLKADLQVVA